MKKVCVPFTEECVIVNSLEGAKMKPETGAISEAVKRIVEAARSRRRARV